MKKYPLILLIVALILALALCACGSKKEDPQLEGTKPTDSQTQGTTGGDSQTDPSQTEPTVGFVPPENYVSVVQVTINPTVNLYLDAEEVILAVEYVNEDAQTCYEKIETTLVGAKVKDGVNAVIETAKTDGYLQENKKVTIDVVETKQEADKLTLLTDVKESAKTYIAEKNIEAEVLLTDAAQKEVDDKIAADKAAADKAAADKAAAEKEKKNPIKNLKTDVEYSLLKPGEDVVLLTGIHITFDANGGYKYAKVPYLNDEFGEGEFVMYNGKKYYVAGGGGGAGTYTMTDEKITMAGAYDMVLTMTVEGELVVEKADSSDAFFVVGDKLTKQ